MATHRSSRVRPPFAWETVLHFANARLTPSNWVAVLLRARGARPLPGQSTYGFRSADEARQVLEAFRVLLSTLVGASPREAEASRLLETINERAKGELKGWTWARGTGRVFPQIRTRNDSFEEFLYAQLATAMTVEPFTHVKQCRSCGRFFYEPRRAAATLCSEACRAADARERAMRYRAEHPDEYREYQRKLMAKRRRARTA